MNDGQKTVKETGNFRIDALLRLIQQEIGPTEYRYQLKRMNDFKRCFHSVESLYAQIYSQILTVEIEIKNYP